MIPEGEFFNVISHALGATAFLFINLYILFKSKLENMVWVLVFSLASMFLLSSSALYHLAPFETEVRDSLRRLDYCAIFIMIVATFTPIHKILLKDNPNSDNFLKIFWLVSLLSALAYAIFLSLIPHIVTLIVFLALGWVGAISGRLIYNQYGLKYVKKVGYGGIFYTLGALGSVSYHWMLHVFVLMGLGMHAWFIYDISNKEAINEKSHSYKKRIAEDLQASSNRF